MEINVKDYARDCAARGLRGDYSRCRSDFTVAQGYDYSAEEQEVWRLLCERQVALTKKLAHRSYLDGVAALGLTDDIPDFDEVNRKLAGMTGWQIVAVPGLIPDAPFFDHLANRRFPVTNWLRNREEIDYIVEPDMFHDFFGHVPVLTQPEFANFMQLYGEKGGKAFELGGGPMMSRLYWYMAEFGLIAEADQPVKAFGAGLMSSFTELKFSVSEEAHHVPFAIETVMRTAYEIDKFQRAYFVLPSFETLRSALETVDLPGMIGRWKDAAPLDPGSI